MKYSATSKFSFSSLVRGIILLYFLSGYNLFSQPQNRKFERLSLEKGIAHNLTYCMLKDSRGFMWFGTMHGLVKYDGKKYTVYRHNISDPSSISFDDIITLYEDSDKNIWIGTWGGGLNLLNPVTEKFTRFVNKQGDSTSVADDIIWAVTEGPDHNIWVGTGTGIVQKYNSRTKIFITILTPKQLNARLIHSLYFDNGILWIGTHRGLIKYSIKENKYIAVTPPVESNNIPFSVNVIYKDTKGNILAGTGIGLLKYNAEQNALVYLEKENTPGRYKHVQAIAEDGEGNLWLGTFRGLKKLNQQFNAEIFYNDPSDNNSLSGNNIISLAHDESGVLWIAAYESGINKIIYSSNNFYHYAAGENGLSDNNITSFAEDNNKNIWIGTYQNGLNKFNPATRSFSSYFPPTYKFFNINSLSKDTDESLLIGSNSGLFKFNELSKTFINLELSADNSNIPVSTVYADNNFIWAGTPGIGLYRINKINKKIDIYSSANAKFPNPGCDYILCCIKDKSGTYWFGTYGGLLRYNSEDSSFTPFIHNEKNSNSLSHNYVFALYEDHSGILWVGTSNGLNRFDRKKNIFTHNYEKDGLPNNVISGIVEDSKNNLWIGTYLGLSRFDYTHNKFKNFSSSDGLQGNIFSNNACLASRSGFILFGGRNGFNLFYPDSISLDNYSPPVYITSVYYSNNDGRLKKFNSSNIELSYQDNFLTFEFAALDFKYPDKISYMYMLEGLDKNWINAGSNNKAVYTNIPDGSYKFKVRGTNGDGVWSTKTASINIIIHPPFWKTWWFLSLSILGLFFLSYTVYNSRINAKIKKAIELEVIRTEEIEKIRRKTALDFHDELGHRLTRISLLAEILKRKVKDTYSEILPVLDKITENSQQLYNGTRDFIWSIDPQKDSLTELLIRLKDFGDDMFNGTDVEFDVNGIDEDYPDLSLSTDWRRHLILIFKEGMNNSLKHSGGKKVILDSYLEDNNLRISLIDDGKGFITGSDSPGNGLKNMKRRAENLAGELEISSEPGKGTILTFKGKIPGNSIHFN